MQSFPTQQTLKTHTQRQIIQLRQPLTATSSIMKQEAYRIVHIDEHTQLRFADGQVALGELVVNVPAERAELAALEDDGVEEREAVQQPLQLLQNKAM